MCPIWLAWTRISVTGRHRSQESDPWTTGAGGYGPAHDDSRSRHTDGRGPVARRPRGLVRAVQRAARWWLEQTSIRLSSASSPPRRCYRMWCPSQRRSSYSSRGSQRQSWQRPSYSCCNRSTSVRFRSGTSRVIGRCRSELRPCAASRTGPATASDRYAGAVGSSSWTGARESGSVVAIVSAASGISISGRRNGTATSSGIGFGSAQSCPL